jgi:fructose-1,6-bisphosphatase/sedoheptulose 1,7-bisphosphatase-like protein
MVLERERHEKLIAEIRAAGARIRLIGDGDLSAGIAAAVDGSGVHAVMGTGGAPEGVLTAGRDALPRRRDLRPARCREAGGRAALSRDGHHGFQTHLLVSDLACGDTVTFVATGVTDGTLMRGVRFFGHGIRTSSIVMQSDPHLIRFIDTIHVRRTDDDLRIRF